MRSYLSSRGCFRRRVMKPHHMNPPLDSISQVCHNPKGNHSPSNNVCTLSKDSAPCWLRPQMAPAVHTIVHSRGSSVKQVEYFSPKWIKIIFFFHLKKIIWWKTDLDVLLWLGQSFSSVPSRFCFLQHFSHSLGIFRSMQHNPLWTHYRNTIMVNCTEPGICSSCIPIPARLRLPVWVKCM